MFSTRLGEALPVRPRGAGKARRRLRWLASTLLTAFITLLGLLVVTFALGRVLPADPVLRVVGDRAAAAAQMESGQLLFSPYSALSIADMQRLGRDRIHAAFHEL